MSLDQPNEHLACIKKRKLVEPTDGASTDDVTKFCTIYIFLRTLDISCADNSLMELRVASILTAKKLTLPVFLAIVMLALPAWAELGGNAASIKADQNKMNGTLKVTTTSNYVVHEIQSPEGVKVREYVGSGGTIFGVSWQGPFKPNLKQLLGPYFDQFVNAAQAHRTTRGPATVQLPGLVVETGGHMRSFVGRAYIPQMVPQGVSANSIQ